MRKLNRSYLALLLVALRVKISSRTDFSLAIPDEGINTVFLDLPFLSLSLRYTPLLFFFKSTKMSLFSTLVERECNRSQ